MLKTGASFCVEKAIHYFLERAGRAPFARYSCDVAFKLRGSLGNGGLGSVGQPVEL